MAISMDEVRRRIDLDEPDYDELARSLGSEALPHLLSLVDQGDPGVAPKAAYLASLIPGPRSLATVEAASRSANPSIRVAAAAALRNIGTGGAAVAKQLLADADPGVRKTALRSSAAIGPEVRSAVEQVARVDPEESLRHLAGEVLRRLAQ